MADPEETTPTIWQGLDAWAKGLAPWKRHIIALATEHGHLADQQVEDIYERFLEAEGLADKKPREEISSKVTGRPVQALSKPLRLDRIDSLAGVNALPDGCSLSFGPGLTVIYGRNGAGKSGFGRLCANVCFSRSKPAIIPDINAESPPASASATFHFTMGDQPQASFAFAPGRQHDELRRIGVFDTTGAQQRVSQAAPLEFKPSGFDIFPEMARVYGKVGERLDTAVKERTHATNFSDSFIGVETDVSKIVATVGPKADLHVIRALAVHGETEKARFLEVDTQLIALKSKSPAELIIQLDQAKADVELLIPKLNTLGNLFSPTEAARRSVISETARRTADVAAVLGTDTFKRPFFQAVGTPEWLSFTKAAHALARQEGETYPTESDRCLMCERPLDDVSRAHVTALLAYVEGDAQRASEGAAIALNDEVKILTILDLAIFDDGSRVREHVRRIDPATEAAVAACVTSFNSIRNSSCEALRTRAPLTELADTVSVVAKLEALKTRIEEDLQRLKAEDPAKAIESLELERQTLRHREVLSQLLPSVETYIGDSAWCEKAERAKSALNPRPITDKEKELFTKIIGESYRRKLGEECESLDCSLPIELQTVGQRGQTVRALTMKGGHRPDTILSEGEQKAIALADFLTEVGLNPISAGIVLDDPVTSQDHQRKESIAQRLVKESQHRQVIVFTHDLPFLNMLLSIAEKIGVDTQAHWIERNKNGKPGEISLNDAPATSKFYDTTERAKRFLADAKSHTGIARDNAIRSGMGALRRTIEETVAKRLLKEVVGRWSDRVMVTALRKINWNDGLADELVELYEKLSTWIEAHSHTDEASGAPPEIKDLEDRIGEVDALITQSRPDRPKAASTTKSAAVPIQTDTRHS